jgi:hypothetical protein
MSTRAEFEALYPFIAINQNQNDKLGQIQEILLYGEKACQKK